jgi:ribonuclease BN (tRNA processing enzyme)
VRLTVVGCSGSFPGPESPASCYLVEADQDGRTWRILLDFGNGALGALHHYADPLAVDAVLFSHLHADHCLDLCGYYVMRKYHPDGARPPIPVWGPAGVAGRMARAYDLPEEPGMTEQFTFGEYADAPVRLGPFTVEAVPVLHPVPAYSLRVAAEGRVLTYSGDTAPCEGFDRAAAGADLLLAEASFRVGHEEPPGIHLTGRDVGRTATGAGVGRVLLTHIPPWHDPQRAVDEARTTWTGPLDLARPGLVVDL